VERGSARKSLLSNDDGWERRTREDGGGREKRVVGGWLMDKPKEVERTHSSQGSAAST